MPARLRLLRIIFQRQRRPRYYGASPSHKPDLPPLLKRKDAVDEGREGWEACAEVLEECLERCKEGGYLWRIGRVLVLRLGI